MKNLLSSKATWSQTELEHVTGRYFGQEFTGKVVADRLHSKMLCMDFTVELEKPIVVFGESRTRIIISGQRQDGTSTSNDRLEVV